MEIRRSSAGVWETRPNGVVETRHGPRPAHTGLCEKPGGVATGS